MELEPPNVFPCGQWDTYDYDKCAYQIMHLEINLSFSYSLHYCLGQTLHGFEEQFYGLQKTKKISCNILIWCTHN